MAQICGQRHESWEVLHELTDPSDAGWAQHLADRLERVRSSTRWLDEGWAPDGLILLDALVRRARRRGGDDLAVLVTDATTAARPGIGRLHQSVKAMRELGATELARWEAGDAEGAKAVRVEQMVLLAPGAAIRQEAARLGGARLPVWSPVAQVVSAYLLLETGR